MRLDSKGHANDQKNFPVKDKHEPCENMSAAAAAAQDVTFEGSEEESNGYFAELERKLQAERSLKAKKQSEKFTC